MRLVCISDLHNNFISNLPEGDILLIAGDLTSRGKESELIAFDKYVAKLENDFKEVIFIPGNHDYLFATNLPLAKSLVTHGKLLLNSSHTLPNGLKIFGSPVTPIFTGEWAFETDFDARSAVWNSIPNDTDIVMTHGPALGVLDLTSRGNISGCKYLGSRLAQLPNLKLHVFGHIHESHGMISNGKYISANVSICRRGVKQGLNSPTVIDID